jgi:hypothetical protein
VAAVGQHLNRDLPLEVADPTSTRPRSSRNTPRPTHGLEVLDEVVAAHVELQIGPDEAGVVAELGAELVVVGPAGDERAVGTAERPCPSEAT